VRAVVALIFGPLVLFLTYQGGYFLLALVLLVATISYWEFTRLVALKGAHAQLVTGELFTVAAVVAVFANTAIILPLAIGAIVLVLFIELYRKKGSPLLNSSVTVFGAFYFSLLFGSLLLIRDLPRIHDFEYIEAGQWLIMLIIVTWVCDTAAYIIGSYFGRHKLMLQVSPNKSIEGTIAGFLFAILAAYGCYLWFIDNLSSLDCIAIGAIAGSFGQYGDLFESMMKRDADVKDTSNLLPGHGGIMDRFDSLMISAPLMYLYLILVVF
jgi:phosphatidate cytidylyltransferase